MEPSPQAFEPARPGLPQVTAPSPIEPSLDDLRYRKKFTMIPPNWQGVIAARSDALLDPYTGQPLQLTPAERAVMIKAMAGMEKREELGIYQAALAHLKAGEQIRLNDVMFANGPLMIAQDPKYGLSPEEIAQARQLLVRLRDAATAMTLPKK